ncbi:MAG: GIY-YIG nuclease family protein [Armatimonadetes bacterium]|nr:GIY-YIG nuclease family protein [Armatimonadota bacterium]
MAKKTVRMNKSGVDKLPDDKPVVYKIKSDSGKNNYTGIAKRGNVQERVGDHLKGGKDYVPGTKVQIEQKKSISEARQQEKRIIKQQQPKYNKQDK